MKIKKWLPLLLAGVMTFSVIGFAGCDTGSNGGSTTGGTQQGGGNEGGTQGGGTQGGGTQGGGTQGGGTQGGGTQGGGTQGGGTQGGGTTSGATWNNADIWLAQTPLVPTEAPTKLPDEYDAKVRSTNISVHDPSIFRDPKSKVYYAFGTHFAVASSYDLIEWKQEATDNTWPVLYGDVGTVMYAGIAWPNTLDETLDLVDPTYTTDKDGKNTSISTTWAPDVEYYNGKYYMYYSITKEFGSSESAIGRVESDNVLGPYTNNRILIESVGETGNHPNCIDPELFYDKDGRLWMVYGSHFAGVYIKELYNEGANWGLPKEDGWGKLLWKGGGQVVEGPYVFYNATNDYYYLMTSYGALMTTYNMRFARSKNPDGPYVDAEGTDLSTSDNNGSIHGNVVAGNYKFKWSNGYAAMGHNSVIKDKNGRYFVVYHTRYQEGSGVTANHNLFVNQLYFNEDGWPVMSPTAYVGEKPCTVTATQVTGEYEIVLHSTATTQAFVSSETYTLKADGKVAKGSTDVGTWTLKQNFYIDVVINDVTYKGVVALGWNNYNNQNAVFSITAISDKGYSLWGVAATPATIA